GAEDALRDVRKQVARNRERFDVSFEEMPVFGTIASRFNDDGVTALYQHLKGALAEHGLAATEGTLAPVEHRASTKVASIVPPARARYLAEIAEAVRSYHATTDEQVEAVRTVQHLRTARSVLSEVEGQVAGERTSAEAVDEPNAATFAVAQLTAALDEAEAAVAPESRAALDAWPATVQAYSGEEHPSGAALVRESLSGNLIPRVA